MVLFLSPTTRGGHELCHPHCDAPWKFVGEPIFPSLNPSGESHVRVGSSDDRSGTHCIGRASRPLTLKGISAGFGAQIDRRRRPDDRHRGSHRSCWLEEAAGRAARVAMCGQIQLRQGRLTVGGRNRRGSVSFAKAVSPFPGRSARRGPHTRAVYRRTSRTGQWHTLPDRLDQARYRTKRALIPTG